MNEFPGTEAAAAETPATDTPVVLTVEQLNKEIRGTLEKKFDLVWVQGELSNFKPHSSGHFYFSLKDSKAQIKAVMFRGFNSRLKFKPHDGLEVIMRGRITVYEPRGDYQITVETMEPVGAGALQKAYEQLKDKLHSEGLFDGARKRPLPPFPRGIALVTSPTGAAIRDMLNILARRNRGIPVTLIPTIVQGEAAAPKIIEALKKAYRLPDVDVIIVGRGGGSIEDLWAFNDEALARTIAESPVPIISAVGHEIDFTIADFVADLRAPTPSAAAELVVQNVAELNDRITKLKRMLWVSLQRTMTNTRNNLSHLQRRLIDPRKTLQDLIQRNDELLDRLQTAIENQLRRKESRRQLLRSRLHSPEKTLAAARQTVQQLFTRLDGANQKRLLRADARLKGAMGRLDAYSPLRTLDRGYALAYREDGQTIVRSVDQVAVNDALQVRVSDGFIQAQVTGKKKQEN
ncbi:MAG: exodeoxyribonuclease VII large subunit [Bdellovibrionaceae bacterium]|nr:exodeoxyribonuclease VII large subunit [Pseudobdellovibrionaceae bacterium]